LEVSSVELKGKNMVRVGLHSGFLHKGNSFKDVTNDFDRTVAGPITHLTPLTHNSKLNTFKRVGVAAFGEGEI